jgi:hypothetical protein
VAQTKEIEVQHKTVIVLRAHFLVAGFRSVEDNNDKSKWVLVVSDAIKRLLGVSMMKTGVNYLKRPNATRSSRRSSARSASSRVIRRSIR